MHTVCELGRQRADAEGKQIKKVECELIPCPIGGRGRKGIEENAFVCEASQRAIPYSLQQQRHNAPVRGGKLKQSVESRSLFAFDFDLKYL